MASERCGKRLGDYECVRERLHPGACKAESGHWWAQYDSGREDVQPCSPLPPSPYENSDMREVWK